MLRLYNSLAKSKKLFKPIKDKTVTMYSCGPTVYDHAHIGNLRAYIFADTLQRVLRVVEGYKVEWVMNITDIDDKMISRIERDNPKAEPMQALGELADKYTDIFTKDIAKVGIERDDIAKLPRATDHIDGMQELIKKLLRLKIAYISEGSIYFSVDTYKKTGKKYGVLVDLDYSAQARVTDDQDQKEGIADFALWKAQKPGEPRWDFEWLGYNYPGRPGWHIECSVMSTQYLGPIFDIHTGGVDLKFPHHENEIAQCGGVQANFFVHNEFLNVEGNKMAKSADNFTTIEKIKDPLAFRLLCLQAHYRSHMDFSAKALEAAHERLNNLRAYSDQLVYATEHQLPVADKSGITSQFWQTFTTALEDDINTAAALAALAEIEGKVYSQQTLTILKKVDEVLGLNLIDTNALLSDARATLVDYEQARANREYTNSDNLRAVLKEKFGLQVSDTPYGALVNRIPK
jgi:cysteinyl-tRNA synthetase